MTRKFRSYLTQATGPLSGSEAAVHEARSRLGDTDTCCILLVDAENAFNTVNRKVALQSVQVSYPIVSKFTMNFFRSRNRHFLGRTDLFGEEGVAQGDPFAIIFYGLSVLPLTYFLDLLIVKEELKPAAALCLLTQVLRLQLTATSTWAVCLAPRSSVTSFVRTWLQSFIT